jgi:hypothetical protein
VKRNLLLPGIFVGLLYLVVTHFLGSNVPGFGEIAYTVWHIGQPPIPSAEAFRTGMIVVDLGLVAFGLGLFFFAKAVNASIVPAAWITFFGLAQMGLHYYPSTHPSHDTFELLRTLGFLAPLALAISWRRVLSMRALVNSSRFAGALILTSIFLNTSPLYAADLLSPEYVELTQDSAFVVFCGWCAYLGIRCFFISDSHLLRYSSSAPQLGRSSNPGHYLSLPNR